MQRASLTVPIVFVLAMAFLAMAVSFLVFPIQPPLFPSGQITESPTLNVSIYGGEISTNRYGFGMSANSISSPGPLLSFKTTDVVNLTFINAGHLPHAFAVTVAPISTAKVLFNAEIGSGQEPLPSGTSGSVVFKPNTIGNYYYICPVPGHAEYLGMWGNLTVTQG